jgi:hypothetical protein
LSEDELVCGLLRGNSVNRDEDGTGVKTAMDTDLDTISLVYFKSRYKYCYKGIGSTSQELRLLHIELIGDVLV